MVSNVTCCSVTTLQVQRKFNNHISHKMLSISDLSPCLLDLDAAAQLLQYELPGVVVDDEHTVLLVRPLVSFEYRHGRRGALEGPQESEYVRLLYQTL